MPWRDSRPGWWWTSCRCAIEPHSCKQTYFISPQGGALHAGHWQAVALVCNLAGGGPDADVDGSAGAATKNARRAAAWRPRWARAAACDLAPGALCHRGSPGAPPVPQVTTAQTGNIHLCSDWIALRPCCEYGGPGAPPVPVAEKQRRAMLALYINLNPSSFVIMAALTNRLLGSSVFGTMCSLCYQVEKRTILCRHHFGSSGSGGAGGSKSRSGSGVANMALHRSPSMPAATVALPPAFQVHLISFTRNVSDLPAAAASLLCQHYETCDVRDSEHLQVLLIQSWVLGYFRVQGRLGRSYFLSATCAACRRSPWAPVSRPLQRRRQ